MCEHMQERRNELDRKPSIIRLKICCMLESSETGAGQSNVFRK
jgi:hypothetical protein